MFLASTWFRCLLALILASTLPTCYSKPVAILEKGNIDQNDCTSRIHASTHPSFAWTSSNDAALSLAHDCLQSHIPQPDACVFYTSHSRDNAIVFAAQHKKKTIYDVYPAHWFNTTEYPADKWVENGVLRDVFRVTSRGYAISCSGAATLVIPETEEPCKTSIWVTDELDAIKSHVSKITELFRASLVGKAGGYWNWVVSKLMLDGGEKDRSKSDEEDSKMELKKRAGGWQDVFNLASTWSIESRATLNEKLEALSAYSDLAEEWAVGTAGQCKL